MKNTGRESQEQGGTFRTREKVHERKTKSSRTREKVQEHEKSLRNTEESRIIVTKDRFEN